MPKVSQKCPKSVPKVWHLGKTSFKKTVFCEKNIQTGRAGQPDFTKPFFLLQRVEKMRKTDQKKEFTKLLPGGGGGSAFYEFFSLTKYRFLKRMASLFVLGVLVAHVADQDWVYIQRCQERGK